MERALKERIVGAIVLVAVIVLVVPVFLDGPPTDEVVSERVPLPGQETQTMQTVVLDRDRDEPVPAPVAATTTDNGADGQTAEEDTVDDAPAETPAEETTVAEVPAEDPPPPVAEPMPEAVVEDEQMSDEAPVEVAGLASSTGMWAVQIGSFSSQENAENRAADLRRQGFAAFLSRHSGPSGPLHRVRVGPQRDREEAEAMAARLSSAGHGGQVVPHP